MGDKSANVLIVCIMVIILGLGGLYYAKIAGSYNYSSNESKAYSELVENTLNEDIDTLNNSAEENRLTVGGGESNSLYNRSEKSGYKYNNRYYYNSLSEEAKAIYDAIVNNIDKLKTGNARIDIDYDFNKVFNNGNGQDAIKAYYDDAINALNLDVPNLFYINFSKMYLNIESSSNLFTTKCKLYINSGKNENYFADNFETTTQVEIAASQVGVAKDQVKAVLSGTDYNKIRTLHDWLIDYMTYDSTANNRASVYGALIEKKGVCESYSRTLKYVLDSIGIENILVVGTATNSNGATEDHMWNYVEIDGKWYAIDPTWDDPIVIGGGVPNEEMKHRYFLKGSQDFYKNHAEKLTISPSGKIFTLPKLEVNNY